MAKMPMESMEREKAMGQMDLSNTQLSDAVRFEVSFTITLEPIVINTMHEWRLTVLTADGAPVYGLDITVEGSMPMHNHGLPTAPQVTSLLWH